MTEATPPPEEQKTQVPFDTAILEKFKATVNQALAEHPELRSVAVVFDFEGGLNDAQVNKGLWVGRDGPVIQPNAIFGSIKNVQMMVETMFDRSVVLTQDMKEQVQIIAQENITRRQQQHDEEQPGNDQPAPGAAGDPVG